MGDASDWYFLDKTLRPGGGHGWAAHEHAVVTLVLYGRLDEGLDREVQRCGDFELHYKPAGLPHATASGPRGVRMLLVGARESALEAAEAPAGPPRTLPGGARAARALADLLSLVGRSPAPGGAPRGAIRRLWRHLADDDTRDSRRRPSWITEAHERIRSEGAERRSLTRLAHHFGVHPVYLARAFHRHYGVTIGALRRRLRADRAVERLRAAPVSLAELALELGYSDQSHFTREFKRETGWTPGRFAAATAGLGPADAGRGQVDFVQDAASSPA